MYKTSNGDQVPTCSHYFDDQSGAEWLDFLFPLLIVCINELIKFMVTEAIEAVRLTTKSEQAMYTMLTVFVAQFFNTALMLLLQRNSLSVEWYEKSGDTIVETMYLQAYVPIVEFFSSYMVIRFIRMIDRGFSSDINKTRLPSMDLYLQVHSGPNFDVEGQYSNMLL